GGVAETGGAPPRRRGGRAGGLPGDSVPAVPPEPRPTAAAGGAGDGPQAGDAGAAPPTARGPGAGPRAQRPGVSAPHRAPELGDRLVDGGRRGGGVGP